jgi:hypothetical protein
LEHKNVPVDEEQVGLYFALNLDPDLVHPQWSDMDLVQGGSNLLALGMGPMLVMTMMPVILLLGMLLLHVVVLFLCC